MCWCSVIKVKRHRLSLRLLQKKQLYSKQNHLLDNVISSVFAGEEVRNSNALSKSTVPPTIPNVCILKTPMLETCNFKPTYGEESIPALGRQFVSSVKGHGRWKRISEASLSHPFWCHYYQRD